MNKITPDALASMNFELKWQHDQVSHTDNYFARKVNLWRDYFPKPLYDELIGREIGETIHLDRVPPESLPAFTPDQVVTLPVDRFTPKRCNAEVSPRYGRFYPKGLLRGLPNVFPGNMTPFRYGRSDDAAFEANLNHPLAGREVRLSVRINSIFDKIDERGGTSIDWLEAAGDGPGMQARMNGKATDFFSNGSLDRPDNRPDTVFYETPRMVNHLDAKARDLIIGRYAELLPPEGSVLDLMSSWNAHLPPEMSFTRVVGLGLNPEELAANPRLTEHVVHDLNADSRLPFNDATFNAVTCTASVEYLTDPLAVFNEVARVLTPGGTFIVSFSNRWFPPKAIDIWQNCHEFERMGLVTEYFLQSGKYDTIQTWSMRGYPRPMDDKYFPARPMSDPVYVVWGQKNNN